MRSFTSSKKTLCAGTHVGAELDSVNFENFLLIDASSPLSVVAGVLGEDACSWKNFTEEKSAALEGVFSATEHFEVSPTGFLFCEGPGSILGIRIAAAAIRARLALDRATGKSPCPVFAFGSLNLASALLLRAFPQEKDFAVIAESRMNCWNVLRVENGVPAPHFQEVKTAELDACLPEKKYLLPAKRKLPTCLENAGQCSVAELLKSDPAVFAETPSLLRDCGETPDAVNTSDINSYARWTPSRHRAS